MQSAKVIESIVDLSGRIGTADGIYAYIALPGARKGPLGKPYFITNVDELLDIYTTEQTIKPSDNLAFFDALTYLSRANKLYCVRPDNGAGFGGLAIPKEQPSVVWTKQTPVTLNTQVRPTNFPATRMAGTYYELGDTMRPSPNSKFKYTCTTAGTTSSTAVDFSGVTAAGQTVEDGSCVWTSADMNHPIGLVYKCTTAGTTGATEPTWPTSATEEVESKPVPTTVTDGTVVWTTVAVDTATPAETYERDPETQHEFGENETMYIFGKYPGKDNDNIGVKIYTYQNYPDLVNEPDAFLLEVYYRGSGQPVESYICSRSLTKKDGYGQNIYVENVLQSSNYINVIDNPDIEEVVDPVDIIETTYMGGGYDGVETISDGMMMAAADLINNRTTFPIKLLIDGNWTTTKYQRKLNDIAASRQDCLALLSTPMDGVENSKAYTQAIVDYRKNQLNLNSYWSAMYTPHVQIYDQYNDRNIWIGASSSAAATISEIATTFAPWYPPAGLNRGVLPAVSDVKHRFNEAQMDMLAENQINPVAFFSGEGIVLWGNMTLYSRPSALQSLNVMLLIITVMPQIAKDLRYYLFEFNDKDTRGLIKTIVDDYMTTVKTNKGVYDFQTSVHATDDDVDNGRLYVDLIIKPALAINEIKFRIVPIRTGGSFTTALQILGAE